MRIHHKNERKEKFSKQLLKGNERDKIKKQANTHFE